MNVLFKVIVSGIIPDIRVDQFQDWVGWLFTHSILSKTLNEVYFCSKSNCKVGGLEEWRNGSGLSGVTPNGAQLSWKPKPVVWNPSARFVHAR